MKLKRLEVPESVYDGIRWANAAVFLVAAPFDFFAPGKWVYKNYLKEYEYESMTDAESFARSMFGACDVFIGATCAVADLSDTKKRIIFSLGPLAMAVGCLRLPKKVTPMCFIMAGLQIAATGVLWFTKPKKSAPKGTEKDKATNGVKAT